MKTSLRLFPRALVRWTGLLSLGLALAFAGCATQKQVASLDAQSNAAMIISQLGDLPQRDGERPTQSWTESNRQIEAFIAAHADQKEITAPLRIRQAMLLLANKQSNLATAAFEAVAETDLHTDRDRALKQNAAHLIWWFSHSTSDTWTAIDQTKATNALKTLAQTQDSLEHSPEIRDYLAEMRAWIGLAAARQTTSVREARSRLEDALDVYARIFSPADFELIKTGNETVPDIHAVGPDLRRRIRARTVLAFAQKENQSDALGAHPKNAVFNAFVNRTP